MESLAARFVPERESLFERERDRGDRGVSGGGYCATMGSLAARYKIYPPPQVNYIPDDGRTSGVNKSLDLSLRSMSLSRYIQ